MAKIYQGMSDFCKLRAENYLDELTIAVPCLGSEILNAMKFWLR